jgi:hypothetical protein
VTEVFDEDEDESASLLTLDEVDDADDDEDDETVLSSDGVVTVLVLVDSGTEGDLVDDSFIFPLLDVIC